MRKGVLLINLGTPKSYRYKDVFRYLNEFLTDKRVIDLPFLRRELLVRAVIVPLRYKTSAKSYKKIWTKEGSPLLVYGEKVRDLLQKALNDSYLVQLAMRYQTPSIEKALDIFYQNNIDEYIILPLFPQYSSSCSGSIFDKTTSALSRFEILPKLRFIPHFFKNKTFIEAHIAKIQQYDFRDYDHILFSFHGLPEKHIIKADQNHHCLQAQNCCQTLCDKNKNCYSAQCYHTALSIASQLCLKKEHFSIAFQSRLGKDPWLKPFTSDVIVSLAKKNIKKVLVVCPSFICDCLETLYEIGIEYHELFQSHGGEQLTLVESLNDHPIWIEALKEIVLEKAPDPLLSSFFPEQATF